WPEIIEIYNQINQSIIYKHYEQQDQETYQDQSISDWAYYRMSLGQYMLTTLLMGGSEKIISEAESQLLQQNVPESMDTDQAVEPGTSKTHQETSILKVSLDSKIFSESTLIGRPRTKTNTPGIEFSVPGQFTVKFTKFTETGGIALKSSDKQTTSSDEKSDTEAEKSLPTEESTQEKKWKRY
ncbi:MAG: hypothetical protein GY861_06065, partial [bacterium]|nr:hypothetical protein [bacterium]